MVEPTRKKALRSERRVALATAAMMVARVLVWPVAATVHLCLLRFPTRRNRALLADD